MTMVILGIVMAGLWIIARWDAPLPLKGWMYWFILAGALAEGSVIRRLTAGGLSEGCLALSVVGGCLLLASVTDMTLGEVYNFVWWPALAAGLVLLRNARGMGLLPLGFFLLLQFAGFRSMYGRADCYAFCVCAVVEAAAGMGLYGFLVHMFLSWALLFLAQAVRGNIDKRGNLKQPVPFLPYIAASFWLSLVLEEMQGGL